MPKTVNSAFRDFLDDEVNLDPDQSKRARNSRDYLITNIAEFGKATDFFDLYSGFNLYQRLISLICILDLIYIMVLLQERRRRGRQMIQT